MASARPPETAPEFSHSSWPFVALFLLALVPLIRSYAVDKFFSGDDCAYFTWILDRLWFMDFAWSRDHAVYLTQWPLVIAVRAGIIDIPTLKVCYGAGLMFPHLLGFTLSVVARRGLPPWPLIFPIFGLLAISLSVDAVPAGEHHVSVALAWPILLFSIRPRPYTRIDLALISLLLILNLRLYENAILTGPLFAAFFMMRSARFPEGKAAHFAFAGLSLASAAIALYWTVFPRDMGNRGLFLASLTGPLSHRQFLLGMTFLCPLLVSLFWGSRRFALPAVALSALLPFALLLIAPPPYAGLSFACRTLGTTFIPPLLVIIAWLLPREPAFSSRHLLAFALFVVAAATLHVYDDRGWIDFRDRFRQTLQTRTGFVPIEDTSMHDHLWAWDWNNAFLSYLWSDGTVRAIVLNPRDNDYDPFDPQRETILSRYLPPPTFVPLPAASMSNVQCQMTNGQ